ncbi:hypothetical protein ABW19_dt0202496 [Dactylella cylindrospora]|nr:hypothetical protein ABW19_dt0202496 [Dactylella cylindrospora]
MANPDILLHFASRPDDRTSDSYASEDPSIFESSGARTNHLPTKTTQILSTSVTDADIKEVLTAFNSPVDGNNADSRRRLRAQVLQDLANSNSQVINDFGLIATQVRDIGDALKAMHESFNDISCRVDAAATDVNSTLQESDTMMVERLRINRKQAILETFLRKFTISPSDLANITSSPQALNDEFFDTLDRVKVIHSDCQILLGSDSTRAG